MVQSRACRWWGSTPAGALQSAASTGAIAGHGHRRALHAWSGSMSGWRCCRLGVLRQELQHACCDSDIEWRTHLAASARMIMLGSWSYASKNQGK
jgi:hypothetical protein